MAARLQLRRRARGAGLSGPLIERDDELALIELQLAVARDGRGTVTYIEAPAGKGKSRLLTIAGDLARGADMQVLGAQATELEREFPFGVVTQLLEPRWFAADETERDRLTDGPAWRAKELLAGGLPGSDDAPGDHRYAMIHALFWLTSNLAGQADAPPLAMLIDDAHWADASSLRFLAYLAERIAELPVALLVTARSGEEPADARVLAALRDAAERSVLRPQSLSEAGVAQLVSAEFPDADDAFCSACALVTSGTPLLLVELLAQLSADGAAPDSATAARLADLAPEAVINGVVAHLGAMDPAAQAVATAVAVLGDGASLLQVAELAQIDARRVGRAADALAARHFLHAGSPLSFVHPMIASAVRASLRSLDRAELHRRAAAILTEQHAHDEQISAHLLAAHPGSDPHAVQVLRGAARRSMARGAPESAVRFLSRALAERPSAQPEPELLAELGEAQLSAGLPDAAATLESAIAASKDELRRAELTLALSTSLYAQGRYEEAADTVQRATDAPIALDESLVTDLRAAYVTAASVVSEKGEEMRRVGAELLDQLGNEPTLHQRRAVAHLALRASLDGKPRESVRELVKLAWGDGVLLTHDSVDPPSWPVLTAALLFVDELESDLQICDAALAYAAERDEPVGCTTANYCRAWALLDSGRVEDAAAAATATLDAGTSAFRPYVRTAFVRTAYGAIACCEIERGELARAETALSIIDHPDASNDPHLSFLLDARSRLRLAQRRPAEALSDAREAGRLQREVFGSDNPGVISWRSTTALAHLALGDESRAIDCASEELASAQAIGITRLTVRGFRILGLAEQGQRGLELLDEAVRAGESQPQRLEYIHALLDYGSALRRANYRAAARKPLRLALELSHRGGARVLAGRARTELAATGARPRREMLSGVESLTPSERRVGELAARGLTNREIAKALFVTPKTIEFHLRHVYQKLDVSDRAQLGELLGLP